MTRRYDVRTQTTDQLLKDADPPFVIPEFQRGYAWQPEEVDELVEDLFPPDGAWIAKPDADVYFLGSLVVAKVPGERRVLDGQQRLTTLSLLIAVLRARLGASLAPGQVDLSNRLLVGPWGTVGEPAVRLQPEDAGVYREALEGPAKCAIGPHKNTSIGRATRCLVEAVDAVLATHAASKESVVVPAMVQRVLNGIELVLIEASDESTAFRLFETLNDRGLPLNAADLIKNKLFALAHGQLPTIRASWDRVLELVPSAEILHFLRHFWIARDGRSVSKLRLYETCAEGVKGKAPVEIAQLCRELEDAAKIYQGIAKPKRATVPWSRGTVEALDRLSLLRARSCRPALLACATTAPKEFEWFVSVCESAVIRHTVVGGRNPNQLERGYAEVCGQLKAGVALRTAVAQALGPVVPSDQTFTDAFTSMAMTSTSMPTRVLLMRLNAIEGTGELPIAGPQDVHVEHVLPQRPSQAALTESECTREGAAELAPLIGNLTLLSGKKNMSISNAAFSAKREQLATSEIALNRSIAKSKRWRREEIEGRGRQLAHEALEAWKWDGELAAHLPVVERAAPARAAATRSTTRAGQLKLPIATRRELGFPPISKSTTSGGGVYLPRILWALEYARRNGGRAKTAAELARILTEHGGFLVQETNMARAFRDLGLGLDAFVENTGAGYVIRERGVARFAEIFEPAQPATGSARRPAQKAEGVAPSSQRPRVAKTS
jgi:hypothetical protein